MRILTEASVWAVVIALLAISDVAVNQIGIVSLALISAWTIWSNNKIKGKAEEAKAKADIAEAVAAVAKAAAEAAATKQEKDRIEAIKKADEDRAAIAAQGRAQQDFGHRVDGQLDAYKKQIEEKNAQAVEEARTIARLTAQKEAAEATAKALKTATDEIAELRQRIGISTPIPESKAELPQEIRIVNPVDDPVPVKPTEEPPREAKT